MVPSVSLVLLVYNSATVLPKTLEGIEKQEYPLKIIYIIDDFSQDNSVTILKKYQRESKFKVKIITHTKNIGWSASCNEIIRQLKTDHAVTLNADCVIKDKNGIKKLITPFIHNKTVVESCSKIINPLGVWERYNFWQKCLFSRHVGKIMSGRNSAFCCFSVAALKRVGLFDERRFRTAGEDADMMYKLEKMGKIVDVDTIIEHIHNTDKQFSILGLFKKRAQHAEAAGVVFSVYPNFFSLNSLRLFLPFIMVIGLFVDQLRIMSLTSLVGFSFWYTAQVYTTEWKNLRVLLLPFINILCLMIFCAYFTKGFIIRKQLI